MKHRIPPSHIPLLPHEHAALAQARAALALAVPQIRDADLRRSLHGALCKAEMALGEQRSVAGRTQRREGSS